MVPPRGGERAGRVVTVGTGTCVPRLRRGGPCVLLESGGFRCVVDLGLGALHGLLRAGVAHGAVDALLLTHHHPDHLAELLPLLFAANYGQPPRRRPLQITGSPGSLAAVARLAETQEGWLDARNYLQTSTPLRPGDQLALGPFRVRAGAVAHIDSSLAYRFETVTGSVVVSGDTGPSESLVELARSADLLLLEASLAAGDSCETHLTAQQAGTLADRAGVGHLVLVHLYPAAEAVDPGAAAAAAFGGPVTVAEDGMEWEF
ncbi:MAG: MBL fold metallo-hydrolase [Deferrisomatales bacterium]|nr:MBL fold metallo-hydrolase [Deferrisomatales bacterium]